MCVVTLSHDLSYDVCMCRGDPCTWTVHVHPLCQSYYGCSNGTVTKHGSTGHPSKNGFSHLVQLLNLQRVTLHELLIYKLQI